MARKNLIKTSHHLYHVTSRSNNREHFYLPISEVWSHFSECLEKSREKYDVKVHAFVLMPNHFHMLVSTPQSNLGAFMRHLISTLTYRIQKNSERINHIFGGRYRWSILESAASVAYVLKYIYRNPVRAGICFRSEEYCFSTLKNKKVWIDEIPEEWAKFIPPTQNEFLDWLNQFVTSRHEELIRLAMRRYQFKFPENKNHRSTLKSLRIVYGCENEKRPDPKDRSARIFHESRLTP